MPRKPLDERMECVRLFYQKQKSLFCVCKGGRIATKKGNYCIKIELKNRKELWYDI